MEHFALAILLCNQETDTFGFPSFVQLDDIWMILQKYCDKLEYRVSQSGFSMCAKEESTVKF